MADSFPINDSMFDDGFQHFLNVRCEDFPDIFPIAHHDKGSISLLFVTFFLIQPCKNTQM